MDEKTVFCLSDQLDFVKSVEAPGIAISCYVQGFAGQGRIGFDCSDAAKLMRKELITNKFEFDGIDLRRITVSEDVFFAITPEYPWMTAKYIIQPKDALFEGFGSQSLSEETSQRILKLLSQPVSRRVDHEFISRISKVLIEENLELQFWPYMVPYKSIVYVFGEELAGIRRGAMSFFRQRNYEIQALDEHRFPVF